MDEVSEDIHFIQSDLQRVHTRYVEVIDPNIPDIIENATRVEDILGILNLLRSETPNIDNLFTKTKDDCQETVATLIIFTKTTESKLKIKSHFVRWFSIQELFGLVVAKM